MDREACSKQWQDTRKYSSGLWLCLAHGCKGNHMSNDDGGDSDRSILFQDVGKISLDWKIIAFSPTLR